MNLKTSFILHFFPCPVLALYQGQSSTSSSVRRSVYIGVAWARFSMLIHAGPDLSLLDGVILHLFCSGLDIDADLCLDMTAGGRFTHKPMIEQVKFLENLIDRHTSSVIRTKPL